MTTTPLESPSGVVFDLDGTLVDNMAQHAEAFRIFAERYGLPPLTTEMRARLDGKRNRDIFPILFDRDLSPELTTKYTHEKESLYREISRGKLAPMRGLLRFLDALDRRGVPYGIATSAPPENVQHSLAAIGLRSRIASVMRSDEVPRGKPHPDVFLAAAALIGADPSRCLAFEDAPAGVASAKNAGMFCVALSTTFAAVTLTGHSPPPDLIVADYDVFLAGPGARLL